MAQLSAAARLALLCWAAEQIGPVATPNGAGAVAASLAPPAWVTERYHLCGWITGEDSAFGLSAGRVFYGWVLADGPAYVLVLRGTESAIEWLVDFDFPPRSGYRLGGEVESGFYGLYETLDFQPAGGAAWPLLPGVRSLVGWAPLTITGHSLGAALATYATVELAEAAMHVAGRFIASPRPGDAGFADAFAARVTDAVDYHYAPDIVGDVPAGFGYSPLHCVETIPANLRVPDNPASNHHAVHYAWLLDPASLEVLPEAEREAVMAGLT
ncbi:MAG TPA: hypothetical protein VFN79_18005 [Steroidobacteraceae bacterium]|nr:hypothetical protein [Steroidobacteraceae bacterium]